MAYYTYERTFAGYCDICDVDIYGKLGQHNNGKKHRRRAKKKKELENSPKEAKLYKELYNKEKEKCEKLEIELFRKKISYRTMSEEKESITEQFIILQASLNPSQTKEEEEKERDISCQICMEKRKEIAFQCGHVVCEICSKKISICPYCKKVIESRLKIHL